jgi:bifunctional NMN adenylyltransferase/nudix hydrolase
MSFGVFIGRFQPFHNGHLSVVLDALSKVDKLIIAIGSCNTAKNIKNPWTAEQREAMIRGTLSPDQQDRIQFVFLNDYTYNDNMWVSQVQNKIEEICGDDEVILFGRDKDRTTYYLSLFPQWKFSPCPGVPDLDATRIRDMYFHCDLGSLVRYVPEGVYPMLRHFMMVSSVTLTGEFTQLKEEFEQVAAYKAAWKGAPYPPTFVTTDAVVIQSGHVLVVRRRCQPGKGLLALPGGFLNQHERVLDGCVRELKEETGIAMDSKALEKSIVAQRVFDHPDRSLRGRTITHAYCFDLGAGKLPRVKGSDDAEKAMWIPISEVSARGNEFFEDHAHIVSAFLYGGFTK